jgi:hypothetical protein
MDTKQWYLSKAVWGSLATMVVGMLMTFGLIGSEQAEGVDAELLADNIIGIIVGITGIISLIGRLKAKTTIQTPNASATMFILILLPVILLMTGCEGENSRRDYVRSSYILAGGIEAAASLADMGKLSPEEINDIDIAIDLAQMYRAQWRLALDANEQPPQSAVSGLEQVLDRLIEIQLTKEKN